jgi:Flp pilus assembly protein TadG
VDPVNESVVAPPRDAGTADALGLALLAPVAIALALVVVFVSRQVDARAQVRTAAESAAQAGALERTPAAAEAAARRVLDTMLVDPDTCAARTHAVDVSGFEPGGVVAVTVTCAVSPRGLGLIEPPARSFTVTASATIDPHRAAGTP